MDTKKLSIMGKKILFADDDEAFRFTLSEYFEDSPMIIETAENGVVALDKVLAENYDLVVLDINMPFMKGTETIKVIKQKYPKLKVLALTAFSSQSDVDLYLKEGFDDVIPKPVNFKELLKKINSYIYNKKEQKDGDDKTMTHAETKPLPTIIFDTTKSKQNEFLLKRIKILEVEKENLIQENKNLKEEIKKLKKL